MYKSKIEADLKKAILELSFKPTDTLLSIPENDDFGDYTTNIALQLAKQKLDKPYHSAQDIASDILDKFGHPVYLERVEIAGGGFINFYLKDQALLETLLEDLEVSSPKQPEKILVEYASPNAFKPLHIGHLRNITIGEAISRLLRSQGNDIFRVTYTSDIGPAVAKAIWGVENCWQEFESVDQEGSLSEKADFLGKAYVKGVKAYEEEASAKEEIDQINKKLYQKDRGYLMLWEKCRQWSKEYLNVIYSKLGTKFDAEVWESEVGDRGAEVVKQNIGKVFIEDQGAVIFPGEKFGLHNRVFITSAGTPTYEAKELGVTFREEELFPFDKAIHVVSAEQTEYFRVVIKAIEEIEQRLKGKKIHLPHGFVSLSSGKMSSRTGNIVSAEQLIETIKNQIIDQYKSKIVISDSEIEQIAIAAAKFYMLNHALRSDIVFDIQKSISLQGDSGPYLLYTYARINSLLTKSATIKSKQPGLIKTSFSHYSLEIEERAVLRMLEYFDVKLEQTARRFAPNELCEYLIDLAKAFNLFYERHPILGSQMQDLRLGICKKVAQILKRGLYLLGIETVEKM